MPYKPLSERPSRSVSERAKARLGRPPTPPEPKRPRGRPPSRALTDRQLEAQRAIELHVLTNGTGPTYVWLGERMGVTRATAQSYVSELERKGWVKRGGGKQSLAVTRWLADQDRGERPETVTVRLLGRIAAGQPIEVVEESDRVIELPNLVAPGEGFYYLRVHGTSMVDDHILDGDLVLAKRQDQIDYDGQIAVVLVKGREATLKRVYREGSRVRLQPASAEHEPRWERADDVVVQGRVVSIIRLC
jgi:repressor LexA